MVGDMLRVTAMSASRPG